MSDRYASLKQGLVGCWIPSISGSGLLLPDLSGRGNNGSLVGMDASDWVSASYGRALDIFDDQYIDGGMMQGLSLAYPFSMSCWLYNVTTGAADFSPFSKITSAGGYLGAMIYIASATNAPPRAYWAGGIRATGTTIITQVTKWTQVGICWTGSEARVIVNGRIDGTGATTTAPDASASPLSIGRYAFGANRSMRGLVDDCRMYDRCLTNSEWSLLASEPGIGFKPAKKLSRFSQRFTYKPAKPRNYSVIRNRDPNYSTLRQGLVAAYCPSISGQGNVLPDLVGGNHGTLTNMDAPDWVSSGDGRALDFDGSNDNVASASGLGITGNATIAISFWMLRRSDSTNAILGFGDSATVALSAFGAWVNAPGAGVITIECAGANSVYNTSATVPKNIWTHVLIQKTPGVLNATSVVAINGVVYAATTGSSSTPNFTNTSFYLGQWGTFNSYYFNGNLDDIRIYSRTLTEPEIKLLASEPGIGFKRNSSAFATRYAYKPAKPRNYSVIRNRDPNYSTLRQGLVAAYCPSISGQGNVLPDLVGGNHGTLTNMTADDWVSSGDGRALDFDGSNDRVSTTETSSGTYLTQDFSHSIWINTTRTVSQTISQNRPPVGGSINTKVWWILTGYSVSGEVSFNVFDLAFQFGADWDGLQTSGANIATGTWRHIAVTKKGATASIFIDGKLNISATGTAKEIDLGKAIHFALNFRDNNTPFLGLQDDARIYNRALTESEIKLLASKRGIGLEPRKPKITFADLGVQKTYSVVRVKETDYATLRQGLVGAWCPSLPNGGSGNTLPDQSGYNNHGTLTNMSPDDWVSGQYGRALDFDGSNDWVSLGNRNTMYAQANFTIVCFAKWVSGEGCIYSEGDPDVRLLLRIYSDGTINGGVNVSNNWTFVTTTTAVATQTWNHIAYHVTADAMKIFINGVEIASVSRTFNPTQTITTQIIGRINNSGGLIYFNGQIDDLRTYNRSLNPTEIRLLASRPGIGLRQESHRQTFYQFPSGARRKRILTGMP